ncbi:hypothetical protein ACFO4U_03760 [Exiguobacterium profundum]|uniref:hypothetical protein n=1 Tax=Exiguobacterium TaxID=33986 RepID=UPI001BFC1103|nr:MULTISPECIES: hypothetical protein [Exiguobacterium]MCT4799488.1 hypothetical protein [Exiguobacterium profundum]MDT0191539.1 hypothetical protein [Exiguobacterium sp. BG5(2022)]
MEQLLTLPDVAIRYVSSGGDWTTEREKSKEDIVWVLVLEGKIGIEVDAFELSSPRQRIDCGSTESVLSTIR